MNRIKNNCIPKKHLLFLSTKSHFDCLRESHSECKRGIFLIIKNLFSPINIIKRAWISIKHLKANSHFVYFFSGTVLAFSLTFFSSTIFRSQKLKYQESWVKTLHSLKPCSYDMIMWHKFGKKIINPKCSPRKKLKLMEFRLNVANYCFFQNKMTNNFRVLWKSSTSFWSNWVNLIDTVFLIAPG